MHIFTLEIENGNIENAEFVSAPERSIELEQYLQSWFENNPWILVQGEDMLWIHKERRLPGSEVPLRPDLIGVDASGKLVIVELKRSRTPRDTVAQLLDYAAWADGQSDEQIRRIAEDYFENREGFQDKTFDNAFRSVFDLLKTDEVPPLNRDLRLFIVAGRISERILKVCKFLRASYGIDVNCIEVSMFHTESGDVIVGIETKLGNESRGASGSSQTTQRQGEILRWQVVWRKVLQLTNGNPMGEFTTGKVKAAVLEEHPNFNENTISGSIHSYLQSRHIVSEAIQQLGDRNTGVDFTAENILKVILEEPPDFNQLRIREMVNMFCQFGIQHIQPNQMTQGTEN